MSAADELQRLHIGLREGVTAAPIAGDDTTRFWLNIVNTGDELQRIGAFMVLLQIGVGIEVSLKGS